MPPLRTYRRLLSHFAPEFLLGLTATPDRTDQSDILTLCDDNLVYRCHSLDGIESGLLSPFHYFGILDESVDYREVPWRNGRFDPEDSRTSWLRLRGPVIRLGSGDFAAEAHSGLLRVDHHADFMAEQFDRAG